MIRYKTNKNAIIMTALIILLCLVSLTGATYALFTNDPNDGTIGIVTTSGDVEIDIVDLDGKTLQGEALDFITTAGSKESAEVLFEPGATFYTQGFKVENKGNILVNFRLSVSKDDTQGTEEYDNVEEFNRAFDVWVVKEGDDPATAKPMKEFKVEGLLPEGSSATYYLFIKMKESVDNTFQGKTYTGIGVTVYAVQGNVYDY